MVSKKGKSSKNGFMKFAGKIVVFLRQGSPVKKRPAVKGKGAKVVKRTKISAGGSALKAIFMLAIIVGVVLGCIAFFRNGEKQSLSPVVADTKAIAEAITALEEKFKNQNTSVVVNITIPSQLSSQTTPGEPAQIYPPLPPPPLTLTDCHFGIERPGRYEFVITPHNVELVIDGQSVTNGQVVYLVRGWHTCQSDTAFGFRQNWLGY